MNDVDYCVVGAGFAGLTAALRLTQAGHSVVVLEARDRVGGRTWTVTRDDGTWIDRGGAWVGATQDRIYALMNELGVATYKQYTDGDSMMFLDGRQHRYTGTVPLTMSPWVVANVGAVFLELGQMCKSIPIEAPWTAKNADKWDRISLARWLSTNTASKPALELLEAALAGLYTSAASEVSMLFALYQMASGGGPAFVLGNKGGSQDARVVGGMGAIYNPIAAQLGDSLHLSQPVRRIEQDASGVTVRTDGMEVRAGRVIVTVPIAIASHILYEPMLPMDRAFLHQRMPSGAVYKINIVYDQPFWRDDNLSGQSLAPRSPATVTIDASTDKPRPGVLCVIVEGPMAREIGKLGDSARRTLILSELMKRFGDKAGSPVDYIEQNWSIERYSGGGMLSHTGTGVLTEFGHALREPCGRIHWAGTESSAAMCGWVDGAIRSGERVAGEVMAADVAVATV